MRTSQNRGGSGEKKGGLAKKCILWSKSEIYGPVTTLAKNKISFDTDVSMALTAICGTNPLPVSGNARML
jgi:hypothetical protein